MNNSNIRILVLDDEPFMLKLLARMLANLGYAAVSTCDNGHDALLRVAGTAEAPGTSGCKASGTALSACAKASRSGAMLTGTLASLTGFHASATMAFALSLAPSSAARISAPRASPVISGVSGATAWA